MKQINCNFCGSKSTRFLYTLKDWLTKNDGVFTLVECQECGLRYLNPQPSWEELKAYYPTDYRPYALPDRRGPNSLFSKIKNAGWRRRRKVIEKKCAGGRLLDVGCATGQFLAEMEIGKGWECYGVEPVLYAAAIARQNTHAAIFDGTLLDANYPNDFFDVVTLWDVLEHISDPLSVIRETRRILKPGGVLIMCTPDPESITGRWFGPYWIGLDAPRHLHDFPKSTLVKRLKLEHFENVSTAYITSDHYKIWGSLAITSYSKGHPKLGNLFEKIALSLGMRILLAGFFLAFRWLGIGSSPVYFAQKY